MPAPFGWTNNKQSISLILRKDTLYYALLSSDGEKIEINQCDWPNSIADSSLPSLVNKSFCVQYIVPPEDIRIIHLDKPEGLRGKALVDYARIELLNYIDTPIEETLIHLVETQSLNTSHLTVQVVLAEKIKKVIDILDDHGISIDRISLPDGGFNGLDDTENKRKIIIALDPAAPRILRCYNNRVEHIQPLPQATLSTEQGLCPSLSNRIEQWAKRHCLNETNTELLLLAESPKATEKWLHHFRQTDSLHKLNWKAYPANQKTNSFAAQWVYLAAKNCHSKQYHDFDLCWSRARRFMSRFVLWPSYLTLAASLLFVGISTIYQYQTTHHLLEKVNTLKAQHKSINKSLGQNKNTVLGSYTKRMLRNKTLFTSALNMLSTRSFPGLWLDTITLRENDIRLVGSSSSLSLLRDYTHWLEAYPKTTSITLNELKPQNEHAERLKSALSEVNVKIQQGEKNILTSHTGSNDTAKKSLLELHQHRNELMLNTNSHDDDRFIFDLTLHLR